MTEHLAHLLCARFFWLCTTRKEKKDLAGIRFHYHHFHHHRVTIILSNDQRWLPIQSFNLSLGCQTSYLLKCPLRCEGEFVCRADGNWWDEVTFQTGRERTYFMMSCRETELNSEIHAKERMPFYCTPPWLCLLQKI